MVCRGRRLRMRGAREIGGDDLNSLGNKERNQADLTEGTSRSECGKILGIVKDLLFY